MKYNIALIGTFDYENFGDLMFPIVFKKQVEKRVEIDNLFLFSPNECIMPLNPEKIKIYSIDKLEQVHNEYALDAIVFGGGDLARLDNDFAPEDKYIPQNTSFDMMVYSAVIANKYGIPYLWNCPGVPFEFFNNEQKIMKCLIDEFTDYVSVRESRSSEMLKSCGCKSEIVVSPDTVLSISKIIDKNENGIFDNLKKEFSFLREGYIVFQSCINNIEDFGKNINEQLSAISSKTGKKIVFLAIGNVHKDDQHIEHMLKVFSNSDFVTFDRKLNIYEINAVLANADEFIGTSLHGNVVSNSYGVPSIGLNLFDFVKLKNYFKFVSRSEYCIKNIKDIEKTYFDMVSKHTTGQVETLISKVDNHFDIIANKVGCKPSKNGNIKKLLDFCYCAESYAKSNNVTVFFDCGKGFTAEKSEIYDLEKNCGKVALTVKIPENTNRVRIDPLDNEFCLLRNMSVIAGEKEVELSGNFIDVDNTKENLFFFTKDPQIIFDIASDVKEIIIEFDVFGFSFNNSKLNVVNAINEAMGIFNDSVATQKATLESQRQAISQKDDLIEELQKFGKTMSLQVDELKEKYSALDIKYNKLKNKYRDNKAKYDDIKYQYDDVKGQYDNMRGQYDNMKGQYDNMKGQYDNMKGQYDNMKGQYDFYVDGYNQFQNSFFWRMTSPFRRISQSMKNVVSKKPRLLKCAIYVKGFLHGGFKGAKRQLEAYNSFISNKNHSAEKKREQENLTVFPDEIRKYQQNHKFPKNIKFSILVPLYNTPEDFLLEMINSVQEQTYANWELCLADGSTKEFEFVGEICKKIAKKDSRIVYKKLKENGGISENTNACLKMATGDYIALFDHDDLLHPSALFEYAKVINEKNADFIYCDEVTFTIENNEFNVVLKHHKPEFSPDTLRSYNYICHFTCFSKKLYEIVGGFNKEYDGSQDYDLILRLTEKAKSIVRVPKILYFWRSHKASVASDVSAKPYVVESAKRAILAHMERIGLSGTIRESTVPTTYKIDYDIIGEPKVSIIIPTKDHIDDLDLCIRSIYSKSTYRNFEVIVVENNSTEEETFKYYENIQRRYKNIKVVFWKEKVFNYSAINNFGAKFADGEYVLLLNNDIEILTPNWIEEMLMFAQRKDVGAVGAKLYYPDDTIQHAGVIIGLGGVAGHSHKYYNRDNPGYMARASISQNLSACTAACLLIRKDVFVEIDGIDEDFAVAFNDIDLCMKIRKAGYLIVFTPYAEFYHYESKSRGLEDSPEKIARFNGEISRFRKKWGEELKRGDPYYNPNLTLDREDFSLK